MKPFRAHTPPKHRTGTKVAALVAAALFAAFSAGCAEISQTLYGIDDAVAVALGAQPKSAGGSSGEWVEVEEMEDYDEYKTTHLILAAQKGDAVAVERLLASGANVNAQEMRKAFVYSEGDSAGKEEYIQTGKSALMAAAGKGHLAIVEKLLAAGANVNARCRQERLGLEMYGEGEGITALVFALVNGQNAVAERLLAAGADASDGGYNGCVPETSFCGVSPYPLGIAAGKGDRNMVNTLLRHKADPSTGLGGAASAGHTEIVKLLLDNGAKVNADNVNFDCISALGCAVAQCSNGSQKTEIVRLLLSRGANPNVTYPPIPDDPDDEEETLLQAAKRWRCTPVVKLLQSAGAGKKGAKKRK